MTVAEAKCKLRDLFLHLEQGSGGADLGNSAHRLVESVESKYRHLMSDESLLLLARAFPTGLLHRRLDRHVARAEFSLNEERRLQADTQSRNRLPDFLVVGPPKCGTTTLYSALKRQPGVFLPQKELEFFSSERFFRPAHFSAHYEGAPESDVWGEVSTGAFADDLAISRVKASYGSNPPKVVICMRDPVARAISHYRHRSARQVLPGDFGACCRYIELRHEFVETGNFPHYCEAWREAVGTENLKVVNLDDLRDDRIHLTLDDLCCFLGLPGYQGPLPQPENVRREVANELANRIVIATRQYAHDLPSMRFAADVAERLYRRWFRSPRGARGSPSSVSIPSELQERLLAFRSQTETLFGIRFSGQ